MDFENEFLQGLIELQYGQDVAGKLKELSSEVGWAKGWPENKKSFWNAEAFMWNRKVGREKQKLISSELEFLNGRNLDMGCGAYSYVKSVGFDLSSKMLDFNDNLIEKVQGDLEKDLPFSEESFDSVTAVFVLNYVKNLNGLLSEVKRILSDNGMFVAVLYSGQVNDWQRQKEMNSFDSKKWIEVLSDAGFNVNFYEKQGLWFFKCGKNGV